MTELPEVSELLDHAGPADPQQAVEALAACTRPYLIGVRHHSPALAAVVPALLDRADPQVLCVELPADFQRWIPHLADPGTAAPVALAGTDAGGGLGFYPFADFSPELAAIRWAHRRGVEVRCCDLPLGDKGWTAGSDHRADGDGGVETARGAGSRGPRYGDALAASGTGREGDDLWDRSVEVRAPGSEPEAVRRAALAVGWALRNDAAGRGGVPAGDLAREARMRRVIAEAAGDGRRVAAVVGAFHGPALLDPADAADGHAPAECGAPSAAVVSTDASSAAALSGDAPSPVVPSAGASSAVVPVSTADPASAGGGAVTSLVPYTFELLDARSGYPAGIRDPRWQQAVVLIPLLTPQSKKAHYALWAQDFARKLVKELPSAEIKKIASALTTASNEKMREERAADKGNKKTKAAKTKVSLNSNRDNQIDNTAYGDEDGLGDDDFM